MEKTYNIGKKWRKVFSYTLWMFEYYVGRTQNELLLDNIDVMIMMGLKNTYIIQPEKVKLNEDQMKFFLVMVDYINKKLLTEVEPPYTKKEMEYFKSSQQFMKRFNTFNDIYEAWAESRLQVFETINKY